MARSTAPEPLPPADYFVGLDLGQSADYSALAVLEVKHERLTPPSTTPGKGAVQAPGEIVVKNRVRYLYRWELGTPYPTIVREVIRMVERPPFDNPYLVIDFTGVGAPVTDLFRDAGALARLRPVLITGGHQESRDDRGVWHVPKKSLVAALQILLQTRSLSIAKELKYARILQHELAAFRVKVHASGSGESFEAWRERDHDDLVLSVALGAWAGRKFAPLRLGPEDQPIAVGGYTRDYGAYAGIIPTRAAGSLASGGGHPWGR